jgi:NAD(P)-dependent dehydrogenase (short-subunit alcohol dehydrogenase family)
METLTFNFKEKIALITGSSFGIGKETALQFARSGAVIIMADLHENKALLDEIQTLSPKSIFIRCNVADEASVIALHDSIQEKFGKLDYAFNNAGIEGTPSDTESASTKNWDNVIAVNLSSVFYCMRAQIPLMKKNKSGVIINCSSIAGLVGFENTGAYVASKHGVIGLTKSAALELAKENIRVNAVCPGVIVTPMVERFLQGSTEAAAQMANMKPIKRLGTPREVAEVVLFLCSEGASFIIGQNIAMDGGWTVH